MGFYGNYLKINAGEGLIVEEKGQEIDINLAPQMLNLLNSKEPVIKGTIQTEADFNGLVQGIIPNANNKVLEIGDCFRVIKKIEIAKENSSKYNYDDYGNMNSEGNTIIEANTILMCVKYQEQGNQMPEYKWYFSNYTDLLNKVKIHPVWNGDNNKVLKFYNEEVESDSVEDNSIIVDRENQTISVKKDGEEIIVGKVSEIGLEKGNNGKGLQSVDAENQIQAENSFGFGKGLKNTESNVNQFIRGQYNQIDEENEYIDVVGNGSNDEQRSNAYALDKDGNAYFSGDVYVQSESRDGPMKLTNFKPAIQSNYISIQGNGGAGVEISDIGEYYIIINSQLPDDIYCNDGITYNKIGWPYSNNFEIDTENFKIINNQNGTITLNGHTNQNIEIILFNQYQPISKNAQYFQIFASGNVPSAFKCYNYITNYSEDSNCKLIYNEINKQLLIRIDINNITGGLNFNNLILQPIVSQTEVEFEKVKNNGWQNPIGSQFRVNGQTKIKPNKLDSLIFKSLNKTNNITVTYYKNMNKLLNLSPDGNAADNQIALKRDCQKVYGYEVDAGNQIIPNSRLFLQPYFKLKTAGATEESYKVQEDMGTWTIDNKYAYFMTNASTFYNEKNGYVYNNKSYVFDQFHVYELDHSTRTCKEKTSSQAKLENREFTFNLEDGSQEVLTLKPAFKAWAKGMSAPPSSWQKDIVNYAIDGIFAVDNKYAYIVLHKIVEQNGYWETFEYGYLIKYDYITNTVVKSKKISLGYLTDSRNCTSQYFNRTISQNIKVHHSDNYIVFYCDYDDNTAVQAIAINKTTLSVAKLPEIYGNTYVGSDQFLLLKNDSIFYTEYLSGAQEVGVYWRKIITDANTEAISFKALMDQITTVRFSVFGYREFDRIKIYTYGNNGGNDTKDRQIMLYFQGTAKYITVLRESDFNMPEIKVEENRGEANYLDNYINIKNYTDDNNIMQIAGNRNYFCLQEDKFFYNNELLEFDNGEFMAFGNKEILPNFALIPYSCVNDTPTVHVVKNSGDANVNKIHLVAFAEKTYEVVSWKGEEQWP